MKLIAQRWFLAIEHSEYIFAIGWHRARFGVQFSLLSFDRFYYGGEWWELRIGPLYIGRGPF